MKKRNTRPQCKRCKHEKKFHDQGPCGYGAAHPYGGGTSVFGVCPCPGFNAPREIGDRDVATPAAVFEHPSFEAMSKIARGVELDVSLDKGASGTPATVLEAARAKLQTALDEFSATVLEIVSGMRGSAPQGNVGAGVARPPARNHAPPSPPKSEAQATVERIVKESAKRAEGKPPPSVDEAMSSLEKVHRHIDTTQTSAPGELGAGERATLIAIACTGERGCTDSKLAIVTGYKETSRRSFIQRLAQRGCIETFLLGDVKRYRWTPVGKLALGDFERPERGAVIRELPAGELACFNAIVQARNGCSDAMLAIVTGYKETSRRSFVQRLTARELVWTAKKDDGSPPEYVGRHFASLDAISELAERPTQLTGAELRAKLLEDLPEGERIIFGILAKAHPRRMLNAELGEAADYKETSVRSYLQRLSAREAIDRTEDGYGLAPELRS